MPLLQQIKQDPLLTNISLSYGPTGHIADQVLPPVPVKLEDGTYLSYDKSKFNIPNAHRRPRSRYKEIDWTLSKESYHAEEYGLESRIDDRERDNALDVLSLDETTTEILTDNVLNNRERRVSNLVMNATNVPQNTTLAGAAQWSDASGGDPLGVAVTAATTIQGVTGYTPNQVTMGYKVWQKLLTNPKVTAMLGDTEQLTTQRLAQLFGVQKVVVGTTLYNTAKGGQTAVLGDMWGKHVLFSYTEARPAQRRPSFGYQFVVQALRGFRWRDTPVNSDVLRVSEIRAEKIVASQLGYLVLNAVA